MTHPKMLTVAEVAARVRVSKMTVYRLVHTGELAGIRVGRSLRIPETIVDAYLERSQETLIRPADLSADRAQLVIDAAVALVDDWAHLRTTSGHRLIAAVGLYLDEQASVAETEAILADPDVMAAIAEAEAEV